MIATTSSSSTCSGSSSSSGAAHGTNAAAAAAAATASPPSTASPPRVQKHHNPHFLHHHPGNGLKSSTPQRPRLNSREIPRSYSGLYGQGGDDLLPFELARNWHTDWLERGGLLLLGTYVGGICIFQVVVLAVMESSLLNNNKEIPPDGSTTAKEDLPLYWSWTVTNAVHCLLTTVYLHWLKGSLFDEQGEMSAMTLWEQLEGRPNTIVVKRTLTVVPTLLCYAACHFSQYDGRVCLWNVILWSLHVAAKLPFMNGVRVFGINRTTGIDDVPVSSGKQD
jgi:hypothetical protein